MTKPITSVGFMMLLEEGRVAVDTPVADVPLEFGMRAFSRAPPPARRSWCGLTPDP